MTISAPAVASAIRTRLTGDATLAALVQGVWVGDAPHQTALGPSSSGDRLPYILITFVVGSHDDAYDTNVATLDYDVSVFLHRDDTASQAVAVKDRAYELLHKWKPTLTGMAADVVFRVTMNENHAGDAWHFVDTYRVWVTEV